MRLHSGTRSQKLNKRSAQAKALKKRITRLEAQLASVYGSYSWRVTAPLRAASLGRVIRNARRAMSLPWWLITGRLGATGVANPLTSFAGRVDDSAGQVSSSCDTPPRNDARGLHYQNLGIELIDVQDLRSLELSDNAGVAVVMPCIDKKMGMEAAAILAKRAGMECKILVIHDSLRQGYIKTLNDTAAQVSVRYVVYLAQDAYPGRDWLRSAHDAMEQSGKGLLGFNDGKFRGRIASFGMVRTQWVKGLYGGPIFYPGYIAHAADNELTVIARALDMYTYEPDCTLVEYDLHRESKPSRREDAQLFRYRYFSAFDGLVPREPLIRMAKEYKIKASFVPDLLGNSK